MAPRTYKSRLQCSLFTGPTARKDAEARERTQWIEVLAAMLFCSPTPLGEFLRLSWAVSSSSVQVDEPRLSAHGSEPPDVSSIGQHSTATWGTRQNKYTAPVTCKPGSQNLAHVTLFLVHTQPWLLRKRWRASLSQRHSVMQKELLASTIRERPSKQAPRMLTVMLSRLEAIVVDKSASLSSHICLVDSHPVLGDFEIRRL